MTLSVNGAKSYLKKHDVLSIMLSIAQSSTNYVLAARLYQMAIQQPADYIIKNMGLSKIFGDAGAGNDFSDQKILGLDVGQVLKSVAEFTLASLLIFVISSFSKSSVKSVPMMLTVSPTGFYSASSPAVNSGGVNFGNFA